MACSVWECLVPLGWSCCARKNEQQQTVVHKNTAYTPSFKSGGRRTPSFTEPRFVSPNMLRCKHKIFRCNRRATSACCWSGIGLKKQPSSSPRFSSPTLAVTRSFLLAIPTVRNALQAGKQSSSTKLQTKPQQGPLRVLRWKKVCTSRRLHHPTAPCTFHS